MTERYKDSPDTPKHPVKISWLGVIDPETPEDLTKGGFVLRDEDSCFVVELSEALSRYVYFDHAALQVWRTMGPPWRTIVFKITEGGATRATVTYPSPPSNPLYFKGRMDFHEEIVS